MKKTDYDRKCFDLIEQVLFFSTRADRNINCQNKIKQILVEVTFDWND